MDLLRLAPASAAVGEALRRVRRQFIEDPTMYTFIQEIKFF